LDGLPHEVERDLLVAIVRQADHEEDIAKAIVTPYIKGNIGDLLDWMRSAEPIRVLRRRKFRRPLSTG
jgi:hypothetical protein